MSYARGGRQEAAAAFAKAFRSRGWTRYFVKAVVYVIVALFLIAVLAQVIARTS